MVQAEQVGRAATARPQRRAVTSDVGEPSDCNEVRLRGRIAACPEQRELPSGDMLTIWRLIVARPPSRRPTPEGVRPVTVDTFDCVAWTAALRRTARTFAPGDVVQVEGALRRRFWQAGGGAVSRVEVEVAAVRRLARAAGES